MNSLRQLMDVDEGIPDCEGTHTSARNKWYEQSYFASTGLATRQADKHTMLSMCTNFQHQSMQSMDTSTKSVRSVDTSNQSMQSVDTSNQSMQSVDTRSSKSNLQKTLLPSSHTSAVARPGCFTTAHTYSVPLESASVKIVSACTPFFLQKPRRALLGLPSGPKATCKN